MRMVFLTSVLVVNEYFLHEGINDGALAHHLFKSFKILKKKSSIFKSNDRMSIIQKMFKKVLFNLVIVFNFQ